jgi:hypothetical protein
VTFCALLIAGALTAGSKFALADDEALRPQFELLYAQLKTAMAKRDQAAIRALLEPDFVSMELSGDVKTVDQLIADLSVLPVDPAKKSETTVVSIDATDDRASVVQTYHMTSIKKPWFGKAYPLEIIARSTDEWHRHGNAWLMAKTRTDELEMRENGATTIHKIRP